MSYRLEIEDRAARALVKLPKTVVPRICAARLRHWPKILVHRDSRS